MTSKYKINPCKACEKKLQGTKCNVNTMNDCCYSTLAAFSGAISSNAIVNDEASNNCKECVQKVMDTMGVFGRSPCDLKLSAPPLWLQSPHYIPDLLEEGHTPKEAFFQCMSLCKNTRYPDECKSNCQTDFDAIEFVSKNSNQTESNINEKSKIPLKMSDILNQNNIKLSDSVRKIMIITLTSILILFIVFIIVRFSR